MSRSADVKEAARAAIAECEARQHDDAERVMARDLTGQVFVRSVVEMMRIDDEGLKEQTNVENAAPRAAPRRDTAAAEPFLMCAGSVTEPTSSDASTAETDLALGPMAEIQKLKKMMKDKKTPDPHAIALTVGSEYTKLRDWAAAIENCQIATLPTDVKKVMYKRVTKKERETEKRLIEHMDATTRAKYLVMKAQREAEQAVAEAEMQRVRIGDAHRELFLCHLIRTEPIEAARHMELHLKQCSSTAERTEVLVNLHTILKAHKVHHIDGQHSVRHSKGYLLLKNSLGNLPDFHIRVLSELLVIFPHDKDYLFELGLLRTKRWEFDDAAHLMQRFVNHEHGNAFHGRMRQRRPGHYVEKALREKAPKVGRGIMSSWRVDGSDVVISAEAPIQSSSSSSLPVLHGHRVPHTATIVSRRRNEGPFS